MSLNPYLNCVLDAIERDFFERLLTSSPTKCGFLDLHFLRVKSNQDSLHVKDLWHS